jgi:hypothetical protein
LLKYHLISTGIARELCLESLTDEISTENTTLENVEPVVDGQSSQSKGTGCIDVLAPALLPTFPWGPSQIAAGYHLYIPNIQLICITYISPSPGLFRLTTVESFEVLGVIAFFTYGYFSIWV